MRAREELERCVCLHFSSYVCNLSHPPAAALPPESGNQTPSSCKPDGAHEDGPFRGQDGHASPGFATRQAPTIFVLTERHQTAYCVPAGIE